ncbi:MAG: glycoside hydrolase family 15 protein [Actinomycetota bacterium]|jgi:alpha,alpha-trehalase
MGDLTALRTVDGYLPLEDHGVIGDGTTAALVGRDGAVSWLCVPRFDSPPLFCSLLDARRGGSFRVAPAELRAARQRYIPDTGVLVTELRDAAGLMRVTDALALRRGADLREDVPAGRGELIRSVEVLEGTVRIVVEVEPRGGAVYRHHGGGLALDCPQRPDLALQVSATRPLAGRRTELELAEGDRFVLVLRWSGGAYRHAGQTADEAVTATVDAWRRWSARIDYDGFNEPMVRRSAITLKMLDHFENGALVAAPTSSLPEAIGGFRNWDYRYAWIRDAAFSVYALRRIGLGPEAAGFLGWVLDAVGRAGRAGVLYDLDGQYPPPEREDRELEGYRRSSPVRWGNAAAHQRQHDAFGEILDCAYQWASVGGRFDAGLWDRLRPLVEQAGQVWNSPDHGIWEIRAPGRVFTYSAAMCQVALDRAARLADRFGLPGNADRWAKEAAVIRDAILEKAWDPDRQTLREALNGGAMDASLLSLPLRRVVPADHPKMVATTEAVTRRLGAGDGLLYRYLPEESPDGLPGDEGAFLLCSFWLVDNLAYQGRYDEAVELFQSLCKKANHLSLLPEQIHPTTGEFLGNFPQAFSHVGLVSSAVNLARMRPT